MPRSGKNNERTEQVPRGRKKPTKIEPIRPQAKQSDELRRRAEKIVKDRIAKHDIKTVEDNSQLIHELEVHQIELEMQNEELHRTYKDLEDSRNKYSNLYDLAPVGYFTFDKNGVIVEANLTGCQMLGMERAYLIKKPFHLYISEDCQDRFYLHRRQVLETNTRQRCEISLVTKDGKKLEALLESVRAANAKGNNALCHTTVTDITERKQVEHKILEYQKHLKQLAARLTLTEERERRRIAGEIHDEISQTLAIVNIKLDTLRNSLASEASAAEIEEISSSVEKVIQETRTLTFELSNPILYELGFEVAVAEWLSERVQVKHGIATEFQDDGKAKPLDDDVKVMLFRNIRELLINCIKHANAGKIRVNIRRTDGSIEVVVEDNGIGFDPAEVRSTAGKRAKFGLFSVRESLENLGGHFIIESKPGAGCKAIMTAPLKDQSHKKEV